MVRVKLTNPPMVDASAKPLTPIGEIRDSAMTI